MKTLSSLIIRPTQPDDAFEFYKIITHPKVAQNLLQLPSMEFPRTQQFLAEQIPGHHRLVAEKNGHILGAVGLVIPQNPRRYHSGDLDIVVHPEYWGIGIGTALMRSALDLGDNWFNLLRIELEVFANNPIAVGLYEKLGFKIEGTKRKAAFGSGHYHDMHIMARLRT
ncbi:MAG: GNAT family N-acetyltransferase, partial [Candidatus Promineifilaceae bacterium]|nr:GNAT family N-acetyltransferase [Candidatus Promineifilaceae bacterium]